MPRFFGLFLSLAILSACSNGTVTRRGSARAGDQTLPQTTPTDAGAWLCRVDFQYREGDAQKTDYLVRRAAGRALVKQVLQADCEASEHAVECSEQIQANAFSCIHESEIAVRGSSDVGSGTPGVWTCRLEFAYTLDGEAKPGFFVFTSPQRNLAVSAIEDRCVGSAKALQDGCSQAILAGGMSCANLR